MRRFKLFNYFTVTQLFFKNYEGYTNPKALITTRLNAQTNDVQSSQPTTTFFSLKTIKSRAPIKNVPCYISHEPHLSKYEIKRLKSVTRPLRSSHTTKNEEMDLFYHSDRNCPTVKELKFTSRFFESVHLSLP